MFWGAGVSHFGNFRALETPGGDLSFQGAILEPNTGRKCIFWAPNRGVFWMLLGSVFEVRFLEGLWITFLTILGWFWTQFWGRFRFILDTTSEPAQNHEKLDYCCYLLYFRHVADPENDPIPEQFDVLWLLFQGMVLGPAFLR